MWTEFSWIGRRSVGGLLWTLWWNFRFHEKGAECFTAVWATQLLKAPWSVSGAKLTLSSHVISCLQSGGTLGQAKTFWLSCNCFRPAEWTGDCHGRRRSVCPQVDSYCLALYVAQGQSWYCNLPWLSEGQERSETVLKYAMNGPLGSFCVFTHEHVYSCKNAHWVCSNK
jgi:hypothetical protein